MNLKRGDIHIRDPFVLPVPAEGRYCDGREIAGADALSRIAVELPECGCAATEKETLT